jgi:hypothetical protein
LRPFEHCAFDMEPRAAMFKHGRRASGDRTAAGDNADPVLSRFASRARHVSRKTDRRPRQSISRRRGGREWDPPQLPQVGESACIPSRTIASASAWRNTVGDRGRASFGEREPPIGETHRQRHAVAQTQPPRLHDRPRHGSHPASRATPGYVSGRADGPVCAVSRPRQPGRCQLWAARAHWAIPAS